jgi:hypothetical protein
MGDTIELRCEFCDSFFSIPIWKFNQGRGKYCSRDCSSRGGALKHKRQILAVCAICGDGFSYCPSKKKTYCSRSCAALSRWYYRQGGKNVHDNKYLSWGDQGSSREERSYVLSQYHSPLFGLSTFEGNWEVCQTCNGQDWEYHSDSNILSNAIYRQGHINVALYGDRICYESFNPIAVHWTAPIPDEIKSLLDWIDSMGPDRRICLQEFKPSWENWLAYRQNITGLSLDPRVYQFL